MKCPVCKKEYSENDTECSVCGFTELNVVFSNKTEQQEWERTVVRPCRALWNAHSNMYEKLLKRYRGLRAKYDELKSNYDSLNQDYTDLKRDFDTLAPLSPKVPAVDTMGKPGWNTSGKIAHPNFFTAWNYSYTQCELSNIYTTCSGLSITINFLAKKTYDEDGDLSTSHNIAFKYKLKDSTGVVILTGSWVKNGLRIGDVVKGYFTINNITSSGYVLEFGDYD